MNAEDIRGQGAIRTHGGRGERAEWCPSGAFAEGENEANESIEASSGQKRKQGPLRRLSLRYRILPGVRKIRQEQQNVENLADFSFAVLQL